MSSRCKDPTNGLPVVWVTLGPNQHMAYLLATDGDRKKIKWASTLAIEWLGPEVEVKQDIGKRSRRQTDMLVPEGSAPVDSESKKKKKNLRKKKSSSSFSSKQGKPQSSKKPFKQAESSETTTGANKKKVVWVTKGQEQYMAYLLETDGNRKRIKWASNSGTQWLDSDVEVSSEQGDPLPTKTTTSTKKSKRAPKINLVDFPSDFEEDDEDEDKDDSPWKVSPERKSPSERVTNRRPRRSSISKRSVVDVPSDIEEFQEDVLLKPAAKQKRAKHKPTKVARSDDGDTDDEIIADMTAKAKSKTEVPAATTTKDSPRKRKAKTSRPKKAEKRKRDVRETQYDEHLAAYATTSIPSRKRARVERSNSSSPVKKKELSTTGKSKNSKSSEDTEDMQVSPAKKKDESTSIATKSSAAVDGYKVGDLVAKKIPDKGWVRGTIDGIFTDHCLIQFPEFTEKVKREDIDKYIYDADTTFYPIGTKIKKKLANDKRRKGRIVSLEDNLYHVVYKDGTDELLGTSDIDRYHSRRGSNSLSGMSSPSSTSSKADASLLENNLDLTNMNVDKKERPGIGGQLDNDNNPSKCMQTAGQSTESEVSLERRTNRPNDVFRIHSDNPGSSPATRRPSDDKNENPTTAVPPSRTIPPIGKDAVATQPSSIKVPPPPAVDTTPTKKPTIDAVGDSASSVPHQDDLPKDASEKEQLDKQLKASDQPQDAPGEKEIMNSPVAAKEVNKLLTKKSDASVEQLSPVNLKKNVHDCHAEELQDQCKESISAENERSSTNKNAEPLTDTHDGKTPVDSGTSATHFDQKDNSSKPASVSSVSPPKNEISSTKNIEAPGLDDAPLAAGAKLAGERQESVAAAQVEKKRTTNFINSTLHSLKHIFKIAPNAAAGVTTGANPSQDETKSVPSSKPTDAANVSHIDVAAADPAAANEDAEADDRSSAQPSSVAQMKTGNPPTSSKQWLSSDEHSDETMPSATTAAFTSITKSKSLQMACFLTGATRTTVSNKKEYFFTGVTRTIQGNAGKGLGVASSPKKNILHGEEASQSLSGSVASHEKKTQREAAKAVSNDTLSGTKQSIQDSCLDINSEAMKNEAAKPDRAPRNSDSSCETKTGTVKTAASESTDSTLKPAKEKEAEPSTETSSPDKAVCAFVIKDETVAQDTKTSSLQLEQVSPRKNADFEVNRDTDNKSSPGVSETRINETSRGLKRKHDSTSSSSSSCSGNSGSLLIQPESKKKRVANFKEHKEVLAVEGGTKTSESSTYPKRPENRVSSLTTKKHLRSIPHSKRTTRLGFPAKKQGNQTHLSAGSRSSSPTSSGQKDSTYLPDKKPAKDITVAAKIAELSAKRDEAKMAKIIPKGFVPSKRDVICGHISWQAANDQNRHFHAVVQSRAQDYSKAARNAEKTSIVNEIYTELTKNGRFVEQDKKHQSWISVPEDAAKTKIAQAIRTKLPDKYKVPGQGRHSSPSSSPEDKSSMKNMKKTTNRRSTGSHHPKDKSVALRLAEILSGEASTPVERKDSRVLNTDRSSKNKVGHDAISRLRDNHTISPPNVTAGATRSQQQPMRHIPAAGLKQPSTSDGQRWHLPAACPKQPSVSHSQWRNLPAAGSGQLTTSGSQRWHLPAAGPKQPSASDSQRRQVPFTAQERKPSDSHRQPAPVAAQQRRPSYSHRQPAPVAAQQRRPSDSHQRPAPVAAQQRRPSDSHRRQVPFAPQEHKQSDSHRRQAPVATQERKHSPALVGRHPQPQLPLEQQRHVLGPGGHRSHLPPPHAQQRPLLGFGGTNQELQRAIEQEQLLLAMGSRGNPNQLQAAHRQPRPSLSLGGGDQQRHSLGMGRTQQQQMPGIGFPQQRQSLPGLSVNQQQVSNGMGNQQLHPFGSQQPLGLLDPLQLELQLALAAGSQPSLTSLPNGGIGAGANAVVATNPLAFAASGLSQADILQLQILCSQSSQRKGKSGDPPGTKRAPK